MTTAGGAHDNEVFIRLSADIDEEWKAQANCAGLDPAMFFPAQGTNEQLLAVPLEVCRSCAVRAECLEYALLWHERGGIWGGTTDLDRRKIRRARKRRGA